MRALAADGYHALAATASISTVFFSDTALSVCQFPFAVRYC